MMKIIYFLIIFTIAFLFTTYKTAKAIVDPHSSPNNKYGIHIVDTKDLEDAAKLVNSGGGDWGYVTVVIRADERNNQMWQQVFDKMRELHLIPLVRIASIQTNSHWEKLDIEDIQNWVDFLNSLNWVVENRYLIVGNEPNHAKES